MVVLKSLTVEASWLSLRHRRRLIIVTVSKPDDDVRSHHDLPSDPSKKDTALIFSTWNAKLVVCAAAVPSSRRECVL